MIFVKCTNSKKFPNSVSHYITCDVKLYTASANQIIFYTKQRHYCLKNALFGGHP